MSNNILSKNSLYILLVTLLISLDKTICIIFFHVIQLEKSLSENFLYHNFSKSSLYKIHVDLTNFKT
ncbi:hypothetical protein HOG21_07820 [bacterium]|nr:hypothetical protein [bacterium]